MNIFVVDENHVVKMIMESAQMLSTAHRVLDGIDDQIDDSRNEMLLKTSHKNHPCTVWARKTDSNYKWLYRHFLNLLHEYTNRYGKTHQYESLAPVLSMPPRNIMLGGLTPFAQAMPDEYRSDDPVEAYRNYYNGEKLRFARWRYTDVPAWVQNEMVEV